MDSNIALTMRGICMTFPGVKALDNVDFTLKKGEISALMGENGAGKSTLIKCLTGVNKFEAGEIHVDGIEGPIVNKDTMDAQHKGISTVYQEVNTIMMVKSTSAPICRWRRIYISGGNL